MAQLPYTQVVKVDLTKTDSFASVRGFGTLLFVIGAPVAGVVDATIRTKSYGSVAEVLVDHAINSQAHLAAQAAFGLKGAIPASIKIGYADPANAVAELALLTAYDADWYVAVLDDSAAWTDAAGVDLIIAYFEAQRRQVFVSSFDATTEVVADVTGVAGRNKTLFERASVMYHTDTTQMLAVTAAAYMCTRNFDNAGSAFTMKFKGMGSIPAIDKSTAEVRAITGFVPGMGLDSTQGHFANTVVNVGGQAYLTEGNNLAGGFIAEVYAEDWIVARTQEEILNMYLAKPVVGMTDAGINDNVQAVTRVLSRARSAGIIVPFTDADGNSQNWVIEAPRISSISDAQRRQGIAPALRASFRYATAMHYSTIDYQMTF